MYTLFERPRINRFSHRKITLSLNRNSPDLKFHTYYELKSTSWFTEKLQTLCGNVDTPSLKDVMILLDYGADIHDREDFALRWASERGHLEVVRLLLRAGANVHAKNDLALRWASQKGHIEVVKALVQAGADVHAEDDLALRWARGLGYSKVVEILLS